LQQSGVADGERPGTEEVTCSGRIPPQAPLQIAKVRWDAVLRSFEIRLQCKAADACLPFLVHLRPNPDDRTQTTEPQRAPPRAGAHSPNGASRTLPGRSPSAPKAAHPSVRAGQTVTIFWEGGGMRITRTVVCLDSGSPGQQVRTRGQNGGRVVRAQVVGSGLAVGGVLIALGGILAGLLLEGGNLGQILQPTAAMIVFGGTLGAVLIQFPLPVVLGALRRLGHIFAAPRTDPMATVRELVKYANHARREGIVSLDQSLENIDEPFLKKSLMLAIDGTEPQELRKMMELELDNRAEQQEVLAQVFESAGGFSPTIGIIGAVLGLIQTMQHLDKIDEVGRGIAVAFVATIYGVGAANLFLLPAAGKLKIPIREEQIVNEMTLEGVVSILEGMNPRMLETKLLGFLAEAKRTDVEARKLEAQAPAEPVA
jgi:chemotaxis protein MotA